MTHRLNKATLQNKNKIKIKHIFHYILGGPYAAFGGKDASRGLATFSVTSSDKEYDDLSDLNSMEMESVKEWEAQFRGTIKLIKDLALN